MPDTIYHRPADYDLKHDGDTEDIECLTRLVRAQHPRTVLELGAGSGRLAVPLARAGVQDGFVVTGLEPADEMRQRAAEKLPGEASRRTSIFHGSCSSCFCVQASRSKRSMGTIASDRCGRAHHR